MIKKWIVMIGIIVLSSCGVSTQDTFTAYLNQKKACDYINLEIVQSALGIKENIIKNPKYSDSYTNGFIGAKCNLNWDNSEDDRQEYIEKTISFNLNPLKANEIFPAKKSSEEQLLKKIEKANKSMESYTSRYDKNTIDQLKKGNEDSIRSLNNYALIEGIGDAATLTSLKDDNSTIYEIRVLLGNTVMKINLSSEVIKSKTKEKLIQLAKQLITSQI